MSEHKSKRGLWEFILLGIAVALFTYQVVKPQSQAEQARTAQTPSQDNPQTPSQGNPQTPSQGNPQTPSQGNPQTSDLSPLVGEWQGESTDKGKKVTFWLSFQPNGTYKAKVSAIGPDDEKPNVITTNSNTREGYYESLEENSYLIVTKTICGKTCKQVSQASKATLNSSTELLIQGIKLRKTS